MPRGRIPKPTRQKELAGNPGKRKIKTGEPKPRANNVDVRKMIGINDLSQAFIDRYAGLLKAEGLLTDIDVPGFELAAEHYAIAKKAAEMIEAEGLKTKDDHGLIRKHPLLPVFRDHATAFRNWCGEFGMSPAGRSRVNFVEAEQMSLQELLLERELFGTPEQAAEARQIEKELFGKNAEVLDDQGDDDRDVERMTRVKP